MVQCANYLSPHHCTENSPLTTLHFQYSHHIAVSINYNFLNCPWLLFHPSHKCYIFWKKFFMCIDCFTTLMALGIKSNSHFFFLRCLYNLCWLELISPFEFFSCYLDPSFLFNYSCHFWMTITNFRNAINYIIVLIKICITIMHKPYLIRLKFLDIHQDLVEYLYNRAELHFCWYKMTNLPKHWDLFLPVVYNSDPA